MMDLPRRHLLVTADDFGIGPATSEGILDAAVSGAITSSVLLVNSPHAASAVAAWRQRGCPMELGWHPNLTLDAPLSPLSRVPSLVNSDGRFWPLAAFFRRWLLGRFKNQEIEIELACQFRHFGELTGQKPSVVNTHQHIGVFAPIGQILMDVLTENGCIPFLRRVRERGATWMRVPGARVKRMVLNVLGRRWAKSSNTQQFPGNDELAGVTHSMGVKRSDFFDRWLRGSQGDVVELMCHPGHWDDTLVGRDCRSGDGMQQRRVEELRLLQQPAFLRSVHSAGFTLTTPTSLLQGGITRVQAA